MKAPLIIFGIAFGVLSFCMWIFTVGNALNNKGCYGDYDFMGTFHPDVLKTGCDLALLPFGWMMYWSWQLQR